MIFHLCTQTFLDLIVSLQTSFRSCQILVTSRQKRKKISCPFSSSRKAKRRKSEGTQSFSAEKDLWLWATLGQTVTKKNGWDTSPTNQAGGQTITSASRTKMMKNGRDSETSRHKRIKRRCRRCRPRDFLSLASRGILSKKCLENEGAVKLKQYQCGWRKISRQFTWNILEHPRTSNNDNNNDNNFEKNI